MSPSPLTAQQVATWRDQLSRGCEGDAEELIDVIAELEDLVSAARAVQAEATVKFDAARRATEAAAGRSARRQGRGVAGEIALARKESHHRGQSLLGLAKVLTSEMPHTLARLRDGSLNEFRATILARETGCLDKEARITLDEELCADPKGLVGVGTKELLGRVRRRVATLDPAAVAKRARRAERERRVALRPAPDTMTYLTGLLPMAKGVAAFAALTKAAEAAIADGDPRTKGQLMADLLLARVTGVPDTGTVEQSPAVPVTINITLPATTLAGGHEPGIITANGVTGDVIPAETARLLAAHALSAGVGAWFRQLYTNPLGRLLALTSKQRCFPDGLAELLEIQGQGICATPWCDAPIRHNDHITPYDLGGPTTHANGQGLCEACNHTKQTNGWHQIAGSIHERPTVTTITPTGHRYQATSPAPPGWPESWPHRLDISWRDAVA
ncbi:DUF222 domain-containing protein [Nocardioides caeni]|uniref:HNH endonuclease n=1 Tax=Nocardioides caeni TaxID=574700 RepID=UPI0031E58B59